MFYSSSGGYSLLSGVSRPFEMSLRGSRYHRRGAQLSVSALCWLACAAGAGPTNCSVRLCACVGRECGRLAMRARGFVVLKASRGVVLPAPFNMRRSLSLGPGVIFGHVVCALQACKIAQSGPVERRSGIIVGGGFGVPWCSSKYHFVPT